MTSRILFTCNSKISANEVSFFKLVHEKLRASGVDFIFLSPFEYPGMETFLMRRPGWGQAKSGYGFDRLPTKDAMQLIDIEKWLLRVGYFKGHTSGLSDCLPILEQVAGEALALLDKLEPGLLVAWNSLYPVPGIMHEIAKKVGIPVLDSERGMLPGTLQLDVELRGLHNKLCDLTWADIDSPEMREQWRAAGGTFIESAYEGDFCRYPVGKSGVIEKLNTGYRSNKRPRVLVAGAFDTACGISLGDPARQEILPGFESGFDVAKKVALAHTGITVFKPHPEMVGDALNYDARIVNNLLIGTGHPREYLEWADIVVTYGSLEFDALAFGNPVVLVGRSSLFGKGICYEAPESVLLESALHKAYRRQGTTGRQEQFLTFVGYLLKNLLYRFDTEEMRQRNSDEWCKELTAAADVRSPSMDLHSIKSEVQMEMTMRERAVRTLQNVSPLISAKMQRVWRALKS